MENNEIIGTVTVNAEVKPEPEKSQEQKPEKTFTRDDLNKAIAAEKAKVREQVKNELAEAEKLKNMSEKEKSDFEVQTLKNELEQLKRKDFRNQISKELINKGLEQELADLDFNDADKAKSSIDVLAKHKESLETQFKAQLAEKEKLIESLQEQLKNNSLRGNPPKTSNADSVDPSLRKAFGLKN